MEHSTRHSRKVQVRGLVFAAGLGPLIGVVSSGCDADCEEPNRIDGSYAVWSTVTGGEEGYTGQNTEDYPWDGVFFNGWSEWELTYVPSKTAFQLEINGQPYTADYTQDETQCNTFLLNFDGEFVSSTDTAHSFEWLGDLRYYGTHLGGTFQYSDLWAGLSDDNAGSVEVSTGEMTANLREEGDTGFE